MINVELYTIKEKLPEHKSSILVFKDTGSFGSHGLNPVYTDVEYTWNILDSNSEHTGESVSFDEEDPKGNNVLSEEEKESGLTFKLELLDDSGFQLYEEYYWIYSDELYDLVGI